MQVNIHRECKEHLAKIFEAKQDSSGRTVFPVIIIKQGMGNLRDRNYYSMQAIQSGPGVYEGAKAYFDHPTPDQERSQPNRSVKELAGHYENVRAEQVEDGLFALRADFVPDLGNHGISDRMKHAVEYQKKYPNKDYLGVSINGDGSGETMAYDEFVRLVKPSASELEKIKQIEGEDVTVITAFTSQFSADLVTEPGAGGRVLKESNLKIRRNKMFEAIRKLLGGIEKSDKVIIEDAVKGMLNDDAKKEDEDTSEADLVKALLNAKKEMNQSDGESEEAYMTKCMKQAMANMKKKKEDDKKKEGADDKKESAGEDDKAKEAADKAAAEAAEKAKSEAAAADKSKVDDKDSKKDGDDDKKKESELSKENAELKARINKLEESAKSDKEETAEVKIKLKVKERAELIDGLLAKSGLPRPFTKEIRPVLEACKGEADMKEKLEKLKEGYSKAIEEQFFGATSSGLMEREPATAGNNDDLFQ